MTVLINNHMSSRVWDEIIYHFPNFNGFNFELWEWITNFVRRFIMDIIIYPCWDESESMSLEGDTEKMSVILI